MVVQDIKAKGHLRTAVLVALAVFQFGASVPLLACVKPAFQFGFNCAGGMMKQLSSKSATPTASKQIQSRVDLAAPQLTTSVRSSVTPTTVTMAEIRSYPEGQDSSEMFQVYVPPPNECFTRCCLPEQAGFLKPRGQVHKDGDWHRSVHIWLCDQNGMLLLQRRSEFKDTFPNRWDVSAGGHITGGDAIVETALKETEEELGIKLEESNLEYLCTVPSMMRGTTERHGDFMDNEFQDMFLVVLEDLTTCKDIIPAEGEVAEVKAEHYTYTRKEYFGGNSKYVPRPELYYSALFEAMEKKFPSNGKIYAGPRCASVAM